MNQPDKLTDRKRAAIITAAIAEFRARGFEATSMDRIAAAANVSKRTVYNHFASKDELFEQILQELWDCSAALNAIGYQQGKPLKPQLMELMRQKMAMLRDAYFLDLVRVAIAEAIHAPQRAGDMMTKLGKKEEGVASFLRAAQEDKVLKAGDPAFMSHMLQGQLKSFALWPQVAMGKTPLTAQEQEAVITATVEMFLSYYGIN
ncbi:TetR/AcrR family transcriptional regulator [Duganella sp. Root1480D1]|uniref:TetR/AcrR family transcriptional regulator n=1 Tax=Duganella sp. Root1480D1 TaxID=1736471 RepID=UPI00070F4CC1|nr:TetR/AcrR family transcriptional regulator [Duganella sp. Root1480D1]KQZ25972.1 TetR family transcriptional regulator [Duganella sp. Root1480D1]